LSRIYFLTGLLALGMAVGCKAQTAPQGALDATQNRHVEILVRSQYNIPPSINLTVGVRQPSQIPGFNTLPVTLWQGSKPTVIDFLISTDGKTLARLEKFDLANDPVFSINIANRPIRGNPAAKVTVIDFDDLECPYCSRMHQTLFPATLEHYKDKVRFVYKDNPLPPEMHPWAIHAAVDANCLAAQSGEVYWRYIDYLHTHGQEVNGETRNVTKSMDTLNRIARQQAVLGKLDLAKLDACFAKQDETKVQDSLREARLLHVESAPAVFVNGERIDGALPQKQVWMVIDRALRAAGVEPPPTPSQPAEAETDQ
jgi:protein-disulfide isomerase